MKNNYIIQNKKYLMGRVFYIFANSFMPGQREDSWIFISVSYSICCLCKTPLCIHGDKNKKGKSCLCIYKNSFDLLYLQKNLKGSQESIAFLALSSFLSPSTLLLYLQSLCILLPLQRAHSNFPCTEVLMVIKHVNTQPQSGVQRIILFVYFLYAKRILIVQL